MPHIRGVATAKRQGRIAADCSWLQLHPPAQTTFELMHRLNLIENPKVSWPRRDWHATPAGTGILSKHVGTEAWRAGGNRESMEKIAATIFRLSALVVLEAENGEC